MIRTQIQLTEDQARRLRHLAREKGISLAEMIRRCVERALEEEGTDRAALYARAVRVVGRFPDRHGAADLAREHDRYFEDDPE